ncbi:MAG: hypothetical protein IT285_09325 [Bdellovibrionales bacterium]|nr:hypothetical protein [Bdellovibrionales bacterium]
MSLHTVARNAARFLALGLSLLAMVPHEAALAGTRYEAVGTRWALELSEGGEPMAVHDLSYPNTLLRAKLGKLDTHPETIAAAEALVRSSETDGNPARIPMERTVLRSLKALSELEGGWWNALPWTEAARARFATEGLRAGEAPESFRLSDLELRDTQGRPLTVQSQVPAKHRARVEASTLEDREFLSMDLSSFSLKRDPAAERGGHPVYELEWNPVEAERAGKVGLRPRRIIHLTEPDQLLEKALLMDILRTAIGQLIGQIPIPVVSALISTVTGKYFKYRSELIRLHGAMASEMLRLVETGEAASPFARFTAAERKNAVLSLAYDQATLTDLALWIFNPPLKDWAKDMVKSPKNVAKNTERLAKKGWTTEAISSVTAEATDGQAGRKLYLMDKKKLIGLPPAAIDFHKPMAKRHARVAIASAAVLVDFGASFVPFVGFLIPEAYALILENPMHDQQRREARLTAYLEESDGQRPGDWESILTLLYTQRLNPFALNQIKTRRLVALRKQALGMSP